MKLIDNIKKDKLGLVAIAFQLVVILLILFRYYGKNEQVSATCKSTVPENKSVQCKLGEKSEYSRGVEM